MINDERHIVTLKVCELQNAIKATIKKALDDFKTQPNEEKETEETQLIPRKTVAKMFSISTVSLDKWRRNGLLPDPIIQASRVYYLKSDIEQLIIKRKRKYHGE